MEIAFNDRRTARFLHSSMALVVLIWIAVCALLYYHAPSYQAEQLYDCRWHLSSLAITASLGHIFLQYSQTGLVFGAALVATLYSTVYSGLTLAVYSVDTLMVMLHPSRGGGYDHSFYMKLTAIMIVLALFGLGLSVANAYRLLVIAQRWVQQPNSSSPASLSSGTMFSAKSDTRTIFAITGLQTALAGFSLYAAVILFPLRLWYIRSYTVQEVSCALLALVSVAGLQMAVWRGRQLLNHALVKAIIVANVCQMVHELNMAVAAFYSLSYISRATPVLAALQQLHNQLKASEGSSFGPRSPLAVEDTTMFDQKLFFRKAVIGASLSFHVVRFALCAFVVWLLAKRFFNAALWLRVKFKVDSELITASDTLNRIRSSEKRWLYTLTGLACTVAVGHLVLNAVYLGSGMLYETMTIATGLSVLFAITLALTLVAFVAKQLRWTLILCAYFGLNLLVTSLLLLFAFGQDLLYLISAWQTNAAELDDSPYFFESVTSTDGLGSLNFTTPSPSIFDPTTTLLPFPSSKFEPKPSSALMDPSNSVAAAADNFTASITQAAPRMMDMGAANFTLGLTEPSSTTLVSTIADAFMTTTTEMPAADVTTIAASYISGGVLPASTLQQQVEQPEFRLFLYFGDLVLAVLTFIVAICALRFAVHRLIGSRTLQTQPSGVQRTVRVLHWLAIVGLATVGLELLLLAELQVENQHASHLSMSNTVYDWFLMATGSLFLCYATKHERYQALLPIIVIQLASISLTSLDLLAQQTEVVQVYIRSAVQFYKVTESILRHGVALAIASRPSATGRIGTPISASRTFTLPMATLSVPMHLLIDVLALHLLQILQWFLTLSMLGISLYSCDNLVEDERDNSNDFHELNDRRGDASSSGISSTHSTAEIVANGNGSVSYTKRPPSVSIDGSKIFSTPPNPSANGGGGSSSFDNQLFDFQQDYGGGHESLNGYKTIQF